MDVTKLWTSIIGDGHLWALCGMALGLGALGGLAQAVASATDRAAFKNASWRRAVLGAVAAVAVLYATSPDTAVAFISGSLVAGYVGQALLDALGARAKLRVTEDQVAEAKRTIGSQTVKVRQMDTALHEAEFLLRPPFDDDPPCPAGPATASRTEKARHVLRSAQLDPSSPVESSIALTEGNTGAASHH